jgi:DNA repair protein RadC
MKLLPDTGAQLCLPLAPKRSEPAIADAGDVVHQRHPNAHKLPAELSDAELLTAVLGPSPALSCEWLTTKHDNFRAIAVLNPAELVEHGFTTGAVHRLSAVFEIAKRYGEHEFKIGEPFRGSGDIYAHFREHLAEEMCEHFYAVLLDNKHRKIRDVIVSKGSLTASIVHPRLCVAAHNRGYVAPTVMWRSG